DAHALGVREGRPGSAGAQAVAKSLKPDDWKYLERLPLWLDFPELETIVVHAGLIPGVPLANQTRDWCINLRSIAPDGSPQKRGDAGVPWASTWPGPRFVVFGHDAVRGVQHHPYALGLDSGCVYGKALTAVWLPQRTVVSVPAERVWQPIEPD
ncbi:MAG: metallophosphatase, partial [Archangium sp.]|nr:metallophosphatase [Archangium sp.]